MKAQASLRICAVSPEPLLFAQRLRPKIRHLTHLMSEHARLKNEFKVDEKYHNFMKWHILILMGENLKQRTIKRIGTIY